MKQSLKFKKLRIQNFKSIGRMLEFDFEKHEGLNYIFGTNYDIEGTKNGCGKSTIWDGLLFALFGKTLKNTNNIYIPNRTMLDPAVWTTCQCEVEIDSGDRSFTIKSFIKKPNSCVNTEIYEGEENLSKASVHETRAYIEKEVLKCTFELFKTSIFISSSDKFSFFDMNASKKREYLEQIFKLTCFGEMLKKIRADYNSLEKEIAILQREIKSIGDNVETYEKKSSEMSAENSKKIDHLKKKIELKRGQMAEIRDTANDKDEALFKEAESAEKCAETLSELKNAQVRVASAIAGVKKDITHYVAEKSKHSEVLKIVCSKCVREISAKFSLEELQRNIEESGIKEAKLEAKKVEVDEAVEKIKLKLKKLKPQVEKAAEVRKTLSKNKWIKDHLTKDIKNLEQELIDLKDPKNHFSELLEAARADFNIKKKMLDGFFNKKTNLDILQKIVGEDGAKKFIIKDLVEMLNVRIRRYLDEMGAEFTVYFDESFDCRSITSTGECDYSSFSAGERARINLAIMLTFKDVLNSSGVDSNIFILDEVLDGGIDQFALKSLVNILKNQCETYRQTIYLISHRSEIIDDGCFDNVIEVVKKNNVSYIKSDPQGGTESLD